MKIVHVVRQFSPSVGGLEDAVLNLAYQQRQNLGIDAQVVTLNRVFNREGVLPPQDSVRGIPVVRLPWRGSARYPLAPTVLAHLGEADLIHVHAIDFFFDFLAATKIFFRKPLVVSTHGGFFHTPTYARLKKIWFDTITRGSVHAYDRIIACSENDADIFRSIAGDKLVTIENGIDQSKFVNSASMVPVRTLVSFGRFSPHKRLDLLFPFLRELKKQNPEWKLVVAGRPAELSVADLESEAEKAGVRQSVTFVVEPTDDQLKEIFKNTSWFGSFSEHEGFGLAAVEALSAGLIPILSSLPPFCRLVHKTGVGLLAHGTDFVALAAEVEQVHGDGNAMETQRKRAIEKSSLYNWRDVAQSYVNIYKEILV